MVKSMKPLISYYGGKQRMASKIIPFIPKHTVYAEPFCGGATILFKKPWPNVSNTDHYREAINDTSEQIINMYRMFQTRFDEIHHLLENTLYSEAEHQKAISICRRYIEACDLWRAWAYYVNIQQSFSGKLGAGWRRGVYGRNLSSTWSKKIENLNEYKSRMSSVQISCTDALKFIGQWDSPQTFFYCDPPYPGAHQGHYSGYSVEEFRDLVETLKTIKGSMMLSCYDVIPDEMPGDWKRFEFIAYVSSNGKGQVYADRSRKATSEELGNRKRTEVIWVKQASQPREEIQKLYDSGKYDCFTGDKIWEELNA